MSVVYTGPVTTVTTTGNIDDLDFSNASVIRMNNATLSTIRGLKAGVDGQAVVIESIGAGAVYLAHQNVSSTAANRFINCVTSGVTPLAAGKGTAIVRYDGTTSRWRLVHHQQGAPIAVAYTAGDYTADTGTWTVDSGDVLTFVFTVRGKCLLIDFTATSTTISSALATRMQLLLPNSYVYTRESRQPCFVFNGGTSTTGMARSISTATQVFLYRDSAVSNYAAEVNLASHYVSFEAEID